MTRRTDLPVVLPAVLLVGWIAGLAVVLMLVTGVWPHKPAHECPWVPAAVYCPTPTGLGLR